MINSCIKIVSICSIVIGGTPRAECPVCRACWIIGVTTIAERIITVTVYRVTTIIETIVTITVYTACHKAFFIFLIRQINYLMVGLACKEERSERAYHKTQKRQLWYNHVKHKDGPYAYEYHWDEKCEEDNIKPIDSTATFRCLALRDFNIVFFLHGQELPMISNHVKKTENKASKWSIQSELRITIEKYNSSRNANQHHRQYKIYPKYSQPIMNAAAFRYIDFCFFSMSWFRFNVHGLTSCTFGACEKGYIQLIYLHIIPQHTLLYHKNSYCEVCYG